MSGLTTSRVQDRPFAAHRQEPVTFNGIRAAIGGREIDWLTVLFGNLHACFSQRRICFRFTSDQIWQGQRTSVTFLSHLIAWTFLNEVRTCSCLEINGAVCYTSLYSKIALCSVLYKRPLLNTGNGFIISDRSCLELGSINILTVPTTIYIYTVSLSSEKCTHCESLWMKESAKFPKCKCTFKLWSCQNDTHGKVWI